MSTCCFELKILYRIDPLLRLNVFYIFQSGLLVKGTREKSKCLEILNEDTLGHGNLRRFCWIEFFISIQKVVLKLLFVTYSTFFSKYYLHYLQSTKWDKFLDVSCKKSWYNNYSLIFCDQHIEYQIYNKCLLRVTSGPWESQKPWKAWKWGKWPWKP